MDSHIHACYASYAHTHTHTHVHTHTHTHTRTHTHEHTHTHTQRNKHILAVLNEYSGKDQLPHKARNQLVEYGTIMLSCQLYTAINCNVPVFLESSTLTRPRHPHAIMCIHITCLVKNIVQFQAVRTLVNHTWCFMQVFQ